MELPGVVNDMDDCDPGTPAIIEPATSPGLLATADQSILLSLSYTQHNIRQIYEREKNTQLEGSTI
jgi:hypothetical protein